MIGSFLRWISRRVRGLNLPDRQKTSALPRIVEVHNLTSRCCRFEINTMMEQFRVEQYGDEEEFTRMILNEIQSGDVLYDIGACIGLVTVHAASKGARVVAFEPDPSNRARLIRNLEINRLFGVEIVEWAVSDLMGSAILYTDGVEGWSPSFIEVGKHGSISVPTGTIDEAIWRKELPVPDIVKLDIEGAELLALRGMSELLRNVILPRAIFIEIHPEYLLHYNSHEADVCNLLLSNDFVEEYRNLRSKQLHCVYRKRYSAS